MKLIIKATSEDDEKYVNLLSDSQVVFVQSKNSATEFTNSEEAFKIRKSLYKKLDKSIKITIEVVK